MTDSRPHIIIITTDQQRYDTINALGYPYMRTPNLDRLAAEGVVFEQCYCAAPSCAPSRASFYTGHYPHTTGVYHNACQWEPAWISHLQTAGYHTVNVGKMHTNPMDTPGGFDQRFVVENKDRPLRIDGDHGGFYDEWDRFLNNSGVRKPSRHTYRAEYPGYEDALGAYEWPLEEKFHPDVFVGSMAEWFIDQRQATSPLFLVVGFPGPHPPYDPPQSYVDMYDDVDVPVPEVSDEELAGQPPPQAALRRVMLEGNHDAVGWKEHPPRQQLLRMRRYYAANVTLIDDQVGRILDALERKGYLENSVVLFMSDHGDCLGDHGHIQKWTMYDAITRVPAIAWSPGRLPAGRRVDDLVQQMDLGSMLFELARLEPPANAAESALSVALGEKPGRDAVFAEHPADNLLQEVNFMTMVRTKHWKLVHYLDQPWGELYDLVHDPGEVCNLWGDDAYASVQTELLDRLRDWRIRDAI